MGRTAFERNILPGFARWLLDEIDRRRPDYLVPAETKGARVLDAVLRYASEELGSPISIPVLYGTALAYIEPSALRDLRLLVVDDAVRTGANLAHHRQRAKNYGAVEVEAVACIGDGAHEHDDVDCYLTVGEDLYHEYVWQLTELVVARGLPPEIDHHIFEVRLPVRVAGAWDEFQRLLAGFGELTIDSSAQSRDEVLGMTLHYPHFPAMGPRDEESHEIDKIRFFPDLANNCFYAIPVKFPALRLPPAEITAHVDRDEAASQLHRLELGHESPASVLVDEAKTLNAKTLFRALSTGAEFKSILGLAEVLWRWMPECRIEAHSESFERLYGPLCGPRVAAKVAEALEGTADRASGGSVTLLAKEEYEPRYLDDEVVDTASLVVQGLRDMYQQHRADPEHDPYERIGRSISQIIEDLGEVDSLLVSRCIDFGLAMTVLVPFTGFDELEDALLVERKYRVSEIERESEPNYEDVGDTRAGLSEQTVALLCHNLIERCQDGRDSVSADEVALLVAVLVPLVLADHSIPLTVRPRGELVDGSSERVGIPEVMLHEEERPLSLNERLGSSSFIDVRDGDGHLNPSTPFREKYVKDALPIHLRRSVEEIEARVKILLSLLKPLDSQARDLLARGWAMSTDRRLGLTHVRHSLLEAIEELEKPLRLIRRCSKHPQSSGVAATAQAFCEGAKQKLELLEQPWERPAEDQWKDSLKLERVTLESMAAPEKPLPLYQLPFALISVLEALASLVERLDQSSFELWNGAGAGGGVAVAELAVQVAAEARQKLTTFSDSEPPRPALPEDPHEALGLAAGELLDSLRRIKALLAAISGVYRGPQDSRIPTPTSDKRNSSVLSLDIAHSRTHLREQPQNHNVWKNEGLDIAAQWGRAFGGREGKHREGDDIWFEFPVGDAVVIAAACVQCQARALGSTKLDSIDREFHAAVDAGELEQGNFGNTLGACMDRVTKIAKACDPAAATNSVFVSPEAWTHCSTALRDDSFRNAEWEKEVELDDGTRIAPVAVDPEALLRGYCERVAEFGATLQGRIEAETSTPTMVDIAPEDEGLGEQRTSVSGAGGS